ncbi:hypothetical protein SAM23877_0527 [Streptomyces ambofaciens ATCC 23877]|uniref:Uncharacterized protein n=1 Tax=Streptomyces ambofaciens (strain ATCC 23877 / 3486 / DSM 40053 / JCM 4204 / NBRC 12836 / NRRL B-2516) TaxID=278992 RepID=A0A0K2AKZ4_STRA7|nr:hypothetical protein SAM23877_0527 [Streptomyces ambofaciens ATCC 23877]
MSTCRRKRTPPDGTCGQDSHGRGAKAGAGQDEVREARMIRALHTAVVSTTVINSPPSVSMTGTAEPVVTAAYKIAARNAMRLAQGSRP